MVALSDGAERNLAIAAEGLILLLFAFASLADGSA